MKNPDDRFARAVAQIDAACAEDPRGLELPHAQRLSRWLEKLYPDASAALRLAGRAQHLRRWKIPRASYPEGRIGYLQWRKSMYDFHGQQVEAILRDVGYEQSIIDRVKQLLRKEQIKADAETQALEDAICLAFLEGEFADFAPRHEEEKVISILRKTWGKMSSLAHQAALQMQLPPHVQALVNKALS